MTPRNRIILGGRGEVQKRNLTAPCSNPLEIIASNCFGSAFGCISTIRKLSMLGWKVIRCTSFVSTFLTKITSFPPSDSQLTRTRLPNTPGSGCKVVWVVCGGAGVACGTAGVAGIVGLVWDQVFSLGSCTTIPCCPTALVEM